MTTTYTFTAIQRVQARKYCGFPSLGADYGRIYYDTGFVNESTILEQRLDNCTPEEGQMVADMLTTLVTLEAAIVSAADNLDTDQVAVITRNKSEMADRQALYTLKRIELCDFLAIRPGPGIPRRRRSIFSV